MYLVNCSNTEKFSNLFPLMYNWLLHHLNTDLHLYLKQYYQVG